MAKRRVKYADPDADIWSNNPPQDGEAWVWSETHGRWIPTPVVGAGSPTAHEILSTTHTDTDSTDTEVTGDVLTWDGTQWIAQFPSGGAGLIHYDAVVDSSWTGTDGQSVTLATMATANIYTTIQAALTAADAQTGVYTIRVNEGANSGVYDENLTFPSGLASTDSIILIGEGHDKIVVGSTTSGDAVTFADGDAEQFIISGFRFRGAAASHSVTTSASNVTAHFSECEFDQSVSGDWSSASFTRCQFDGGYDIDSGDTPATVYFVSCQFNGANVWVDDSQYHLFVNCHFGTSSTLSVTGGSHTGIKWKNVRFDAASAINFNGSVTCTGWDIDDGCHFTATAGANGHIYFQDVSGVNGFIIRSFHNHGTASTNPYIKSADTAVRGVQVMATFGRDGSGNYVEDSGGVSVTGIFVDSVFGPCSPPDFGLTLDTGSNDCMYLGTRAVTGTDPDEAYRPITQTGTATPTHDAPESTLYWDTDSNILYINTDGSTTWAIVGSSGAGAAHTLLNGATHSDTETDTPTKGDIIVGDGTSVKWQALAIGTDGQVLTADSATADIGIKWATPSAGAGLDFTQVVSANIATSQNDYAPTGFGATTQWLRLTNTHATSQNVDITGFDGTDGGTAPADGQWFYLTNTATTPVGRTITLKHDSASSAAENRMYLANNADVLIALGETVLLIYDTAADSGTGRWVAHKGRVPTASSSLSIGGGSNLRRQYVWYIDSADSSTYLVTGNHLGPTHVSSEYDETVVRIVHAVKVAGSGASDNLTVQIQDNADSGTPEDLDTESWGEVDSNSLGQNVNGSVITGSFTDNSLPARSLLRLNITAITGNWQGLTVIMETTIAPSMTITTTVSA